ncbi:MAG TPA: Rpn family recombination-promoting nuclease/putative transposase [Atribacteraceae bacterium]|nr:Rpn family recombination-promoting nuclease/putative transposase [Atribacteraceae bacterium]
MDNNNPKLVHQPHDTGYKFLLSSKKAFVQLIRCFIQAAWTDQIHEQNLVRIDKSLILPDFQNKEADLVYRAQLKDTDFIFYVLLELQSRVDFLMPYRLLLYMTELWRSIVQDVNGKRATRKDYRLPVIVPVVLYNAPHPWTAPRHFRETLYGEKLFDTHLLDFRYHLVNVFSYQEEELLQMSNLMGAVFLLDQASDRQTIFDRLVKLIDTLSQMKEDEFKLFTAWASTILTQGVSPAQRDEIVQILEHAQPKEVKTMISHAGKALEKELKSELKKARQQGMEEGMEEGMEKGMEEGMEKGMEKGMEEANLAMARRMLCSGESIDKITQYTGLSPEKVAGLKIQQ